MDTESPDMDISRLTPVVLQLVEDAILDGRRSDLSSGAQTPDEMSLTIEVSRGHYGVTRGHYTLIKHEVSRSSPCELGNPCGRHCHCLQQSIVNFDNKNGNGKHNCEHFRSMRNNANICELFHK